MKSEKRSERASESVRKTSLAAAPKDQRPRNSYSTRLFPRCSHSHLIISFVLIPGKAHHIGTHPTSNTSNLTYCGTGPEPPECARARACVYVRCLMSELLKVGRFVMDGWTGWSAGSDLELEGRESRSRYIQNRVGSMPLLYCILIATIAN
jgi:hypothetical protein